MLTETTKNCIIAYTVSTEPRVVLQNSGFIQWFHPTVK